MTATVTACWSAHCAKEAVTTCEHPIWGRIPVCDGCDAKLAGLCAPYEEHIRQTKTEETKTT
jgi:hypothetical protein